MDDDRPQPPETTAKRDSDLPNFRQLALNVAEDSTLSDPFLDGVGNNPGENQDAVRAILIKHFGYTPEEITNNDENTCSFVGKNNELIQIKTDVNSQGETILEFTAGNQPVRSLATESLKLGLPIVVALAHQQPKMLNAIYERAVKPPHVTKACNFEVKQKLPIEFSRINVLTFTLQSNRIWESQRYGSSL